jgi:hypothetical protein
VTQLPAGQGWLYEQAWPRNENDDLYDPGHNDLLRVSFTSKFGPGKLHAALPKEAQKAALERHASSIALVT